MTTIAEIQDLAAELQDHRPDWPDIVPIVNYLLPWRNQLPLDQLHDQAVAWVQNPGNRTPASLKYMPQVPPKPAGGESPWKEPTCFICGRKRSKCWEMRDKEIRRGVPDPHEFESAEEAERNSSRYQMDSKARAVAQAAELHRTQARDDPWLPADLADPSAARLEADEHRTLETNQPDQPQEQP